MTNLNFSVARLQDIDWRRFLTAKPACVCSHAPLLSSIAQDKRNDDSGIFRWRMVERDDWMERKKKGLSEGISGTQRGRCSRESESQDEYENS
jgi:hypothetical protein